MERLLFNVFGFIVLSICWAQTEGQTSGHLAISTLMYGPYTSNRHVAIAAFQTFNGSTNLSMTNYIGFSSSYRHSIMSLVADVNRKKLYAVDRYMAAIYVLSNFTADQAISSSSWSLLHTGVSRGSVKLAVDWISNNLYWSDPMYRWIAVQSLDNYGMFKILFHTNLEFPLGIAVDPNHNILFWADAGSTPKIERSTLTGANRRVIVAKGILYPTAIVVDVTSSKIFWTDAIRDTVEMATFTGLGRKIVRRLSHTFFYDIALFQDTIFVTALSLKNKNEIIIMNKTTGDLDNNRPRFYLTNPDVSLDVIAVSVVSQATQPLITDHCASNLCSDICVSGPTGYDCLCREGFLLQDGECVEDAGPVHRGLVWSTPTEICVADIRGINRHDRYIGSNKTCKYGVGNAISYVVVDSHGRKIIYADTYSVKAMNVDDMSMVETLFTATETITGLAVDWRDGNVYWCQGKPHRAGQIWVFSQTDSTSYKLVDNLDNVTSISIVPLQSAMLWIAGENHKRQIFKSQLDGTEITVLVNKDNLTSPVDLTVDLDKNLVYVIDDGFIETVRLDGTDHKVRSTRITASPFRIQTYKHYLLMIDINFRTNEPDVDVLDLQDVSFEGTLSTIKHVTDIAILDLTTQAKIYGPCDVANGDCEHLCIPIGRNRVCQCEYGFTLEANKETCTSQPLLDDFILVVDWTHSNIYQVSLVNGEAQGLDSDMIKKPAGIEYNHLTGKVIWGDTGDYLLQQTNLDGTGYEVLVDVGMYHAHPERMAIDYSTGNIFYTSVNTTVLGFSGIAVVTPDGVHKKIVEYGQSPRAIALEPEQGFMFWTVPGTTPGVLMRAKMDGSEMVTLYDKMVWPNGISISSKVKTVFVTDGGSNRIYACTFSGSCSVFHEDPGMHLMDIKLLDDYLFYSAWNKAYITRIDMDTKEIVKFAENAELGRLDAIAVYRSSLALPVTSSCSPNKGRANCSTLCLPNSSGYTCACADGVSLLPDGKTCSDVAASTTTTTLTTPTTTTTQTTTVLTTTTTASTSTSRATIRSLPRSDSTSRTPTSSLPRSDSTSKTATSSPPRSDSPSRATTSLPPRSDSTSRTTTSSPPRSSTGLQRSPTASVKAVIPYIAAGAGGALVLIVAVVIVICFVYGSSHHKSMMWKMRRADGGPRYLQDNESVDHSAVCHGDSVDILGLEMHEYESPLSVAQIRARENQECSAIQNDDFLNFTKRDTMYDLIPADIAPTPPPYEAKRINPPPKLPKPHVHTMQSTANVSVLSCISDQPMAARVQNIYATPSEVGDRYVGSVRSELPGPGTICTGPGATQSYRTISSTSS
ncbi:low-density lipoprotein receptor-related protein 5-like isoform X2 [Mya arenaria]|uniref:low-density lipoprotein receptor-related protein 5-like isoform X2 n=1 Tax=Mya arenaria TaxID=6604 RepID=UPI0022E727A1|nr:low-density lipoprotein receptor-related protein 5-like isoform X2 [Mya arenaria]